MAQRRKSMLPEWYPRFLLQDITHIVNEWPEEDYPPYANGPGYVVSFDIAHFVVSEYEKHTLRKWPEEDYPPYANVPGYVVSSDITHFVVPEYEKHELREWSEEDYPPYANGPGYVVSSDIAHSVISEYEKHALRPSRMGYGVAPRSFTQPMFYGSGQTPVGMAMVPMLLPDGRFACHVWDVLSNKEVVDIVASASARSSATRSLVESVVKKLAIIRKHFQ